MSSDRLTAEQVAILKAADANGKLLHDTDMRRLFRHIEALEGEKQGWVEAEAQYLADVAVLVASAERLRDALEEIRDRHVPDQPAAVGRSREEWVETCHTKLRIIARKALEDDKPIRAAAGGGE